MCKCGFLVLHIAIRERWRDKEKRVSERSYKGIMRACVSACIRGVSRFNRSHVGTLASVQVLESYIGASADHGSISRAG